MGFFGFVRIVNCVYVVWLIWLMFDWILGNFVVRVNIEVGFIKNGMLIKLEC